MNLNRWVKLSNGTLARPRRKVVIAGRAAAQILLRLTDGTERIECWFASDFERRIVTAPEVADHRVWKLANLRMRISMSNVKAERAEARRRVKRAGWRASRRKVA